MESKDILWLFLFTLLLFLSNLLCFIMVGSLRSKALGNQSIYDQVFQDTSLVGNFFCSWISLVVIVSRFSWFRVLISDYNFLLTIICATTTSARHAGLVFICSFCIIRILCLLKMTFLEETVGEAKVRLTYFTLALSTGIVVLFVLFIHDEIVSGLLLTYTDHNAPTLGKKFIKNIIRKRRNEVFNQRLQTSIQLFMTYKQQ